MGTTQDGKRNGDRQPFHRMNINFGNISSSTSLNFLNGWGAYHLWGTIAKKQHIGKTPRTNLI